MLKKLWLTLILVLSKGTVLLKALKVFKFLKFGKILITFLSMFVSVFVYSFIWGYWFAVGFVLLLFIHEIGHVIALKIKHLPASAPVFIPMFGAVIFAPDFGSREDEAFVGFGGPFLGSIAAFIIFCVWKWGYPQSEILLLLSYVGIYINLFNLIPIRPLDGGRITQIVGDWFKYIGLAILLLFIWFVKEPVLFLILIIVLMDFDKMNPRLKLYLGVICEISMIVMMIAGISSQPLWLNIVDIILASVINLAFYNNLVKKTLSGNTAPVEVGKQISSPWMVRVGWLAAYIILSIVLIYFLGYLAQYLPPHLLN